MATPPVSREHAEEAHRLVAEHGSVFGAASKTGLPLCTLRGRYKAAITRYGMPEVRTARAALSGMQRGPAGLPLAPPPAPPGFVVASHSAQTDAAGMVEREWTKSKPAPGEVFTPLPGHAIKGESALVNADGQVLARWIKTREGDSPALVEALREAFAGYEAAAPAIPSPRLSHEDVLTVYPLPDLHFGMYAWAAETGDDYDVDIASKRALESVDALIEQSRPSAHAVILGLGDYFHANDQRNATPRGGHQLDVDGRWSKVFAAGAAVAIGVIERVLRKHRSVEVVFLPGNHDPDAAVCLTVAMQLFFKANKRVRVSDPAGFVWYRRFGKVLLGATHGHTMKPDRMAMMLASDRPEDWGQAHHRHFFFGHIHNESMKQVGPVRCESFSTPASRDAYAHQMGFRSGQSLSAITFHTEGGEVGRHRVNITPERRRIRVKAA